MIDDCISWKYHIRISYICRQISRNIRIISKLRHFLSLSVKQLEQIYFKLIYPYISYTILAWGSIYNSHLKEGQIKQNLVARLIFFVNTYSRDTKSVLPLLNLLDRLTVYKIHSLHALKCTRYISRRFSLLW